MTTWPLNNDAEATMAVSQPYWLRLLHIFCGIHCETCANHFSGDLYFRFKGQLVNSLGEYFE